MLPANLSGRGHKKVSFHQSQLAQSRSPRVITVLKIIQPDQNSNSTCVVSWQTYIPNFIWISSCMTEIMRGYWIQKDGMTERGNTICPGHLKLEYWQSQEGPRKALFKFAGAMLKLYKRKSKLTVRVTCLKSMEPLERYGHKKHKCQIWTPSILQ